MKFTLFFLMFFKLNLSYAGINFENPYLENIPELSDIYDECSQISTMKTIKVKKNHDKADSKLFSYNYSHVENAKDQTTIIYLPGGPGGGSIQWFDGSDFFPNHMNRIFIDPRGTDCNFFDPKDFDYDSVTSVQTAMDIVEIIRTEKLTDYIILGHSYGTLLGTVLNHQINQDQTLPKPKALILEGIIGHHYSNDGSEYIQNHVDIVNQLLSANPKVENLFLNPSNTLMGFDLDNWIYFLMSIPPIGINEPLSPWPLMLAAEPYLTSGEDVPDELFSDIEGNLEFLEFDADLQQEMQEDETDINEPNADLNFLGTAILCREISPEIPWFYNNIFFNKGKLVLDKTPSVQNSCGKYKMDRPYDSKNFPASTPTVYIQGTHDAQTPLKWAKYHYANNVSPVKKFIQVEGGGHSPSKYELNSCFYQILNVVDNDPSLNFSKLINSDGHCRKSIPMRRQQQPRQNPRRQIF